MYRGEQIKLIGLPYEKHMLALSTLFVTHCTFNDKLQCTILRFHDIYGMEKNDW
jgi:hypothetical protein